ncbi:Ribonuclease J2 [Spiroplasma sp. JKS002669]|uniref:ribonuclease J n=1 Tax=Spiroplasma attinicola TaxID=2904537 RepID=UPI0020C16E7C|nr:ribonuclease J [Spiroplasma sp. JKS002669]MCL6428570.1 Ribonuclease J2 [Spiroplasma sp. JKS002669]
MAKIKFVALGGLDERGKNLYLIEINNNIFIFDVGLKFPEREMLGVDVIIPDFSYLRENRQRIKAIFISKPSDDNFGALPYLLRDLTKDGKTKIAIYSSDLTKFMIEQKLKYFRLINSNNVQFKVINVNERVFFNDINVFVDAFNTTSSIPGSLGYAIHSRNHPLKANQENYADETIFYLSDYILVGNENNDFTTKMDQIAKIRATNKANQVLLLISEAQMALRKNFTAPNHKIQNLLEPIIKEAPGRIILACYDQDLFRINEIFQAMYETSSTRKVAVHGRTLSEVLQAMALNNDKTQTKINLKGFNVTFNLNDPDKNKIRIIPLQAATKSKDNVIIVTGSGERLFAKMNKIATNSDDELNLLPDDTVILATPPIPGNELAHAGVLDELARTDVKVISISEKQAWSLQASYEDIKLLTNMLEPKYFLPVKGLYKDLNSARNAAIEAGVIHNNALIQDNGEIVTFNNGVLSDVSHHNSNRNKDNPNVVNTGDIYVDGIGVGDIGAIVIEERRRLMSDGVLITGLTIDRKTKQITSLIDAQMRGVVYLVNNEAMLKNIQNIIINIVEKAQKSNNFSTIEIKNRIKIELQDFMKKETGKIPMILPVINEI